MKKEAFLPALGIAAFRSIAGNMAKKVFTRQALKTGVSEVGKGLAADAAIKPFRSPKPAKNPTVQPGGGMPAPKAPSGDGGLSKGNGPGSMGMGR